MAAPTNLPPHPAGTGRGEARLPWWAIVPAAVAFVVLLLLILNPDDARAAASDPSLVQMVGRAKDLMLR